MTRFDFSPTGRFEVSVHPMPTGQGGKVLADRPRLQLSDPAVRAVVHGLSSEQWKRLAAKCLEAADMMEIAEREVRDGD